MTKTPGTIIKICGATLFAVLLALVIWSLTQPPVTEGPMPPMPATSPDRSN